MAALAFQTAEAAIAEFKRSSEADEVDLLDLLDGIEFGDWVNIDVKVKDGLHSEITAPFLEAFLEAQHSVYQLAALLKYGDADTRHLSDEDREEFLIKVRVNEGSAEYWGDLGKSITAALPIALAKMTPKQALAMVLGLALIGSGTWGWHAYLETTKEIKIEEIKGQERKQELSAQSYAMHEQAELFKDISGKMAAGNELTIRALNTALATQNALLKAAGKMEHTEIGGQSLTKYEARGLRTSTRRQAVSRFVEEEVRVVDVNTSDPHNTVVVLEDAARKDQFRVSFLDAFVQEAEIDKLFAAARKRETVWVKLFTKEVEGEVRSVQIMNVLLDPPAIPAGRVAEADN
jgi:hypothetical protein